MRCADCGGQHETEEHRACRSTAESEELMSGKKHLSDDLSRLRAERDALAARVKKLEQLEMDTRIVLEGPRPNDAEDVERYNQAVIRTREHFAALDNVSTRGAEW